MEARKKAKRSPDLTSSLCAISLAIYTTSLAWAQKVSIGLLIFPHYCSAHILLPQ